MSSPKDLNKERKRFRDIIASVNKRNAMPLGVLLEPLMFEDALPGRVRPQQRINVELLAKSEIVVMVLWKRWGTPTERYSSGFEEEFEVAKSLGKKEIWLYFRAIPKQFLENPDEQIKKVLDFRRKVEPRFMLHHYRDENEWENMFADHLCKWLNRNFLGRGIAGREIEPSAKEYHTTGEASKLLGRNFKTIKRWIYSGKIVSEVTPSGRHMIAESEIKKFRLGKKIDFSMNRIIEIVSERKVVYHRELQVSLESSYFHYDTSAKLKQLVEIGGLRKKEALGHTWYYPIDLEWKDVKQSAQRKVELAEVYRRHKKSYAYKGTAYSDYAEFLVEQALIKSGYVVVSKDAYYFNGLSFRTNSGAGRPKDLDFIAKLPMKAAFIGIQVKNRLEPPKAEAINEFVEICRVLHLKPLLVARVVQPATYDQLKRLGGYVVSFKTLFLQPPFPRDKFKAIREELRIPIGVYQWVPDFLVNLLGNAAKVLSSDS